MNVLVAGATGYIGQAVVDTLVRDGHNAVAAVRTTTRPSWLGSADQVTVNFTDSASIRAAFGRTPIDAVISCMASRGGQPQDAWAVDYQANLALLQAATDFAVQNFVLLSAICVQKPRLEFQRAKLAFESKLRAAPLRHSIVRPTAFFKSLAGQIKRVRQGRPFLLLGDGQRTACKPISARDLARFLVDCLTLPSRQNLTLPIGGPGPAITPLEQGELLFSLLNKAPRYRRIPQWFFGGIVGGLSMASRVVPALGAKAELARIGRYYATESMLVWNSDEARYDANATPEFGADTLEAFYREAIQRAEPGAELGEHSVFS
ncbi:MAG: NAD(P)H-binding protein [Myxococcota bacterium]